MGVSKLGIPKNGWFIVENLLKSMIWGYHYFWKHPYQTTSICHEKYPAGFFFRGSYVLRSINNPTFFQWG